jgi:hypothetical protein
MSRYSIALKKNSDEESKSLLSRVGTITGLCGCGNGKPSIFRRQNTQYCDDRSNYVECCDDCFEEIQAQNADDWQTYYSGLL